MKKLNWKLIIAAFVCLLVAGISQLYSQGTQTAQMLNQMGPYVLFHADSGTFLLNSQNGQAGMLVIQNRAGANYYVFSEVIKGTGAAGPKE